MSVANSTNESSKNPSKPKRPLRIKEFIALGKEIFNEKELGDYDQLLTQKKDLEQQLLSKNQELDAKNKKLSELEVENTTQFERFEKRVIACDTWKNKAKDLENKLTEARETATEADKIVEISKATINDLGNELRNHKKKLDNMKAELEATRKNRESSEYELVGAKNKLKYMQQEPRRLGLVRVNLDVLSDKFRALGVESHNITRTFFRTKLPPNLLPMKELENSGFLKAAPRKIPSTNSDAAQYLRMATAAGIIAEKLCTYIFRPYYQPSSAYDRTVMDEILKMLEEKDDFRETVFRLQLLAAYESKEEVFVHNLVYSTVEEILEIVGPLLFSPGAREDFQSRLTTFLKDAVEVWRAVQKSPWKGVVSNDPENTHPNNDQGEVWILNPEYNDAVELAEDHMPPLTVQEPILSLFPQLSFEEEIKCQGCALWSDQRTVVAAGIEYAHSNPPNLALSRGLPSRWANNRQKPSLGEEPLTPPTSPTRRRQPGGQSFSVH
ncbi:hypothetical protein B0J14DRAFT_233533 [Halenospora varia]|nr:hypothetical protein B0J14DRAFT_233533 [Halenospora varia]